MNVQQLIKHLETMPLDGEATIDVDDGLDGNYMPVLGVRIKNTVMGTFVVIDADVHRIFKKT